MRSAEDHNWRDHRLPPFAGIAKTYAMIWDDGTSISHDPATKTLAATLPARSTVAVTADDVTITGDATASGLSKRSAPPFRHCLHRHR